MDLIFAIFDNDKNKKDLNLSKEQDTIDDLILPVAIDNPLTYVDRHNFGIKKIIEFIRRWQNSITWFHFSGHHNKNNGLKLYDGDFNGLFVNLKDCENLRGIFINGCSSVEIIEKFENEVPICIGTSKPIYDEIAIEFSQLFYSELKTLEKWQDYDTIHEKFNKAKVNLHNILKSDYYQGSSRGGGKIEDFEKEFYSISEYSHDKRLQFNDRKSNSIKYQLNINPISSEIGIKISDENKGQFQIEKYINNKEVKNLDKSNFKSKLNKDFLVYEILDKVDIELINKAEKFFSLARGTENIPIVFNKTIEYFEKSINIYPFTGNTFFYALFLQRHKYYDKSEKMYLQTLEVCDKLTIVYGKRYEVTRANVYNNIGNLYYEKAILAGDYEIRMFENTKAERFFLKSLELRKILAEENPEKHKCDLAMSHNNLGNVRRNLKQYNKANRSYKKAIKIYKILVDQNRLRFLEFLGVTVNNLGKCQWDNKEYKAAQSSYEQVLLIYKDLSDINAKTYDPIAANILLNLALIQMKNNKFISAKKTYQDALSMFSSLPINEKYQSSALINQLETMISSE